MLNEIKHLQKIVARWYDSSRIDNRRVMVELRDGVLYMAQREHPSDVWPPMVKLQLSGIAFKGKK